MTTTITLSRRDLYEAVWAEPMTTTASRYGLSDRGLAKLCERHQIPVPARGYWRRKETGQPVTPDPLPEAPAAVDKIELSATPVSEEPLHPLVEQQLAYERAHLITVPDRVARSHRLVARTRDHLKERRPADDGTMRTYAPNLRLRVSKLQAGRALRIFDTLFKACEERGFTITPPDEKNGEKILVHDDDERTTRADVLSSLADLQNCSLFRPV
jgi:hypothetical protein